MENLIAADAGELSERDARGHSMANHYRHRDHGASPDSRWFPNNSPQSDGEASNAATPLMQTDDLREELGRRLNKARTELQSLKKREMEINEVITEAMNILSSSWSKHPLEQENIDWKGYDLKQASREAQDIAHGVYRDNSKQLMNQLREDTRENPVSTGHHHQRYYVKEEEDGRVDYDPRFDGVYGDEPYHPGNHYTGNRFTKQQRHQSMRNEHVRHFHP